MPQDLKAVQTAYCESHVTLFARSAKFALRYSIQLLNIWLVGLAIAAVAALVLRRSQWVDNYVVGLLLSTVAFWVGLFGLFYWLSFRGWRQVMIDLTTSADLSTHHCEVYNEPTNACFVAELRTPTSCDGLEVKIVGTASVMDAATAARFGRSDRKHYKPEENFPRLTRVGVLPDQHGKGIGKALAKACVDFATNTARLPMLELSTSSAQEPALGIYRALGFQEVRRIDVFKTFGVYEIVLRKSLTPPSPPTKSSTVATAMINSEDRMRRGVVQSVLRWPILVAVTVIMTVEAFCYLLLRVGVKLYEQMSSSLTRYRVIRKRMYTATSFNEWCTAARELDRLEQRDKWKGVDESPYYDHGLVSETIDALRKCKSSGDVHGLMSQLTVVFSRPNLGGINNLDLYNQTWFGTKLLIHDFVTEVTEALVMIRDSTAVSINEKLAFFKKAHRAYGRTALLLSGGAAFGYFHVGVLKALFESKCLPKVICGASAGSLMSAYVCTHTDEELRSGGFFTPEIHKIFTSCEEPLISVRFRRYLTKGYLFDVKAWRQKLQVVTCGDTTFLEAYKKTGRILNISTTSVSKYVPATVLNVFNAPNVVIWSAVLASSAFPSIIEPVEFMCKDPVTQQLRPFHAHGKKWSDGTIKNDIPISEVAKIFDAHFMIVSQVNPHIIPLVYSRRGSTGTPSPHRTGSGYRGGFIVSMIEKFLKLEMRKWLTLLGDLDLLPTFFGQDFRYIFLQPVTGTVTIVPHATIKDFWRIISDPSYDDMKSYIVRGEQATWHTLSRVSNHYRFEALLRESYKFLEVKDRKDRIAAAAASNKQLISPLSSPPLPAGSGGVAPAPAVALLPPSATTTKTTDSKSDAAVAARMTRAHAIGSGGGGGGGGGSTALEDDEIDSPKRKWAEWSDGEQEIGDQTTEDAEAEDDSVTVTTNDSELDLAPTEIDHKHSNPHFNAQTLQSRTAAARLTSPPPPSESAATKTPAAAPSPTPSVANRLMSAISGAAAAVTAPPPVFPSDRVAPHVHNKKTGSRLQRKRHSL